MRISSMRISSPVSRSPNSNLVSAMMMPRSQGVVGAEAVDGEAQVAHLGGDLGADQRRRPVSNEMFSS